MNGLPEMSEDVKYLNRAILSGVNSSLSIDTQGRVKGQRHDNPHERFINLIVDLAHLHDWRVATFRPARVKVNGVETYRTAWGADGKGFPDLVLARWKETEQGIEDAIYYWEVKIPPDKPSPEQKMWLELLGGRVVEPADWDWIVEKLR